MKSPSEWSFSYLLGFQPWHLNLPAPDTLAYWLLLIQDNASGSFDAGDWAAKMSLQLDIEEQAATEPDLYPDPLMPDSVLPLAPVSLARLWSPIPLAVEVLGTPKRYSLSPRGEALVVWHRVPAQVDIDNGPPDVSFFQNTLRKILEFNKADYDSLALVASIGWSYEADKFGRSQRRLMEKAGFIETRRRP